eukprot:CAMPEP_0119327104 /NCGR_PEP_ID=MMETSP1333-20130426/69922_1 /TAXON_ID=418940 /ORGANISM="Scyphosphaera apsteinii, Strain RCC1455" /LENGTH=153 /DNA_ID=CAMNT_0007335595 /DNA_START=619 /DNA_END=1081 /DNA_ORIENTATION=+
MQDCQATAVHHYDWLAVFLEEKRKDWCMCHYKAIIADERRVVLALELPDGLLVELQKGVLVDMRNASWVSSEDPAVRAHRPLNYGHFGTKEFGQDVFHISDYRDVKVEVEKSNLLRLRTSDAFEPCTLLAIKQVILVLGWYIAPWTAEPWAHR